MKNLMVITVILVVVVGAGAFFGGMKYQQSQGRNQTNSAFRGQFGTRNGNTNARPVRGQVISSDDKSITVKMQDGSSKIVLLSDKTAIIEATSSSKQALTAGKQVLAIGTENSDGSLTAQDIQLNPNFGNRPQ